MKLSVFPYSTKNGLCRFSDLMTQAIDTLKHESYQIVFSEDKNDDELKYWFEEPSCHNIIMDVL
jgi:hypothetical protein